MKARMLGAVNSQGPALIFMDSHIECTPGWISPLLDRLRVNRNITAISVVETIHPRTLEILTKHTDTIFVTGFNWDLTFKWIPTPDREIMRRKNPTDPIYSPTMLGAFFGNLLSFFKF